MKWARYLYNPPFSRKVRLKPRTVTQPSFGADLARLPARLNDDDALCGAISFLFDVYRNDCDAGRRLLAKLDTSGIGRELDDIFQRKNLRKLFIECFRDT